MPEEIRASSVSVTCVQGLDAPGGVRSFPQLLSELIEQGVALCLERSEFAYVGR